MELVACKAIHVTGLALRPSSTGHDKVRNLYAHWLVPTGMFAKKALRGETFFAHVHGTDFHLSKWFIKSCSKVLSNVDGVICVSNEQAEVVKSMTTAPVFVQAMGIVLKCFTQKREPYFQKMPFLLGE